MDDALYQAFVRSEVRAALENPSPFDLAEQRGQAEQELQARMTPRVQQLWDAHFAHLPFELEMQPARLAWPRLFTGVFPLTVRAKSAD